MWLDRNGLRKILTQVKKQLEKGVQPDELQEKNLVCCGWFDETLLYSLKDIKFNGKITKKDLEKNNIDAEDVDNIIEKYPMSLWIDAEEKKIYIDIAIEILYKDGYVCEENVILVEKNY